MADQLRKAVAILRPVISGPGLETRLARLIARFVNGQSLGLNPMLRADRIERMRKAIVSRIAKREMATAQQVGRESARPLFVGLIGRTPDIQNMDDVRRALQLSQSGKALLTRDLNQIRGVFATQLRGETLQLQQQIQAAFYKSFPSAESHKQLVSDLVEAEKAEFARLATVHREFEQASAKLTQTTAKGTAAEIKAARKELQTAQRKARTSKTLFGRFATRVAAHSRDAIRQTAQRAQFAHFRDAGFQTFSWVAVNGSDACPDCEGRHGEVRDERGWYGDGPGDGGTLCGPACMCGLVPESYVAANKSLESPLFADVPKQAVEVATAVEAAKPIPVASPQALHGEYKDMLAKGTGLTSQDIKKFEAGLKTAKAPAVRDLARQIGYRVSQNAPKGATAEKILRGMRKIPEMHGRIQAIAPTAPKPIKLGGKNAELAKRAVKRKAAEFVPAKTVKEAEAWAKSQGFAGAVDYKKLTNVDVANAVNRRLAEVHRAHGVRFDKVRAAKQSAGRASASPMYSQASINKATEKTSYELVVNEGYFGQFGTTGELTADITKGRTSQWWVAESVDDLVNHEIGHRLTQKAVWKEAQTIAGRFSQRAVFEYEQLGRYAAGSFDETLAEIYARYKKDGFIRPEWRTLINKYAEVADVVPAALP